MTTTANTTRYARLPISSGSLAAALISAVLISGAWLILHYYGISVPLSFAVAAGSVYSWLVLEILLRSKYAENIADQAINE